MNKAQQQRDWKIRRAWKEIYRLGDKLAKAQKVKDATLRKLMASVREVQEMEKEKE